MTLLAKEKKNNNNADGVFKSAQVRSSKRRRRTNVSEGDVENKLLLRGGVRGLNGDNGEGDSDNIDDGEENLGYQAQEHFPKYTNQS